VKEIKIGVGDICGHPAQLVDALPTNGEMKNKEEKEI